MSQVAADVGVYSLTKPVVMAHPNLYEARAFGAKGKESGTPKFSANFVFEPDNEDLKALKALAAKVARAKWPDRPFSDLAFPFADGNKLADKRKQKSGKEDGDFNRGKVVIAARSKYQPRLSGIENGKAIDYEGDLLLKSKPKFFFGAEVLAQFNLVAYDGVGGNKDGVTAYLNMVFSTGNGKKLGGGGPSGAAVFGGYVGSSSTEDPTGGALDLDDEIPY